MRKGVLAAARCLPHSPDAWSGRSQEGSPSVLWHWQGPRHLSCPECAVAGSQSWEGRQKLRPATPLWAVVAKERILRTA